MRSDTRTANQTEAVFRTENLNVYYGKFLALRNINIDILKTVLRIYWSIRLWQKYVTAGNRLNDLIKTFRAEGKVHYYDQDLYAPDVDPVEVRRQIGMVFQRPNPFPKSIYDNIVLVPDLMAIRRYG